jgi:hypothetical protein
MTRLRMVTAGCIAVLLLALAAGRTTAVAQTPARGDSADAAVTALVAEIRALRAEMAEHSRQQVRAQMLLGRVQMQEQRLAYLDKQKSDVANAAAQMAQVAALFRSQGPPANENPCAGVPADQRRDCEFGARQRREQLEAQEAREQQLRNQEQELANALAAEQARWGEFNSRLDELERTLR